MSPALAGMFLPLVPLGSSHSTRLWTDNLTVILNYLCAAWTTGHCHAFQGPQGQSCEEGTLKGEPVALKGPRCRLCQEKLRLVRNKGADGLSVATPALPLSKVTMCAWKPLHLYTGFMPPGVPTPCFIYSSANLKTLQPQTESLMSTLVQHVGIQVPD